MERPSEASRMNERYSTQVENHQPLCHSFCRFLFSPLFDSTQTTSTPQFRFSPVFSSRYDFLPYFSISFSTSNWIPLRSLHGVILYTFSSIFSFDNQNELAGSFVVTWWSTVEACLCMFIRTSIRTEIVISKQRIRSIGVYAKNKLQLRFGPFRSFPFSPFLFSFFFLSCKLEWYSNDQWLWHGPSIWHRHASSSIGYRSASQLPYRTPYLQH